MKPLPEIIRRRAQNILKSIQTDLKVTAAYPTGDPSGNIVTCILENGDERTIDLLKKKEVTLIKVNVQEDQTEQQDVITKGPGRLPDLDVALFNDNIVPTDDLKEEAPQITKTKPAKKRQTKSKK